MSEKVTPAPNSQYQNDKLLEISDLLSNYRSDSDDPLAPRYTVAKARKLALKAGFSSNSFVGDLLTELGIDHVRVPTSKWRSAPRLDESTNPALFEYLQSAVRVRLPAHRLVQKIGDAIDLATHEATAHERNEILRHAIDGLKLDDVRAGQGYGEVLVNGNAIHVLQQHKRRFDVRGWPISPYAQLILSSVGNYVSVYANAARNRGVRHKNEELLTT